MQFMLIFNETAEKFAERTHPEKAPTYFGAWRDFLGEIRQSGVVVNGAGLHGPHTATTLRVRDGKREVQDGPFADTKEALGGYFIVEVPNLEAALDWAAKSPAAWSGSVEVRPVMPMSPG